MSKTSDNNNVYVENRKFLFSPQSVIIHSLLIIVAAVLEDLGYKAFSGPYLGSALGSALVILVAKNKVSHISIPYYFGILPLSIGCVTTVLLYWVGYFSV